MYIKQKHLLFTGIQMLLQATKTTYQKLRNPAVMV